MRQPIYTNYEQGTPEWFLSRVGVPSASVFDKIVTTKGELSKERDALLFKLAGERVLGVQEPTYQNDAMKRGVELEPEARQVFEMIMQVEAEQTGFCYYDDRKDRGCSPDGLVGDDCGLEIKCPLIATHIGYLLSGKLPVKYFQQVQGSMYVTNRKHWYFMSYYPGLSPLIIKTNRDEKFIEKLHEALETFCKDIDDVVEKIRI